MTTKSDECVDVLRHAIRNARARTNVVARIERDLLDG